jgi:hypothetical protein
MLRAKKSPKRKVRNKTMPVLSAAGVTLSLLTAASAALANPSLGVSSAAKSDNVTLRDEEVSDVSLATFYVFDREDHGRAPRLQLAGGFGCAGCATCAGACAWGGNYYGYGPSPLFNQAYPPYEPMRPPQRYRRTHKRTDDTW